MYWELQPTAQGCQLVVEGQPIGSPSEPPPSGWLQRQYGILMPPEYERMRYEACGYVGNGFASQCPTREDYLPYCDPCTGILCGCVVDPGCQRFGPNHPDCQRPPRISVDPNLRVSAYQAGYLSQQAWQEAGGTGLVPREWAETWMERNL